MNDLKFDKEQAKRINEFLDPIRQKELLDIISKGKVTTNCYLLDLSKFSKEFGEAVEYYFEDERVNGYQRIYIPDELEDDLFEHSLIIKKALLDNGFTDKDIILVDNTW